MGFWSFASPFLLAVVVLAGVTGFSFQLTPENELLHAATTGAVVGAVVGAVIGHCFNWHIVKSTQQWEQHRHLITSGERFCDELLKHVERYWGADWVTARHARVEDAAGISISILLITRFVQENFAADANMQKTVVKIIDVTGDNYPKSSSKTMSREDLSKRVWPIIELRLSFSSAKQTH